MEELIDKIRELMQEASATPGFVEFAILGCGAMLEYIFPPFPGDAVVLLGAFCVGRYEWSLPAVWIAVTLGSFLGLSLDYAFGVWVGRKDASWRKKYRLWARLGNSIDRFEPFYRRWGVWCIAANRFVPALRAVFFVAAGMSEIKYWKVVVLGLLSATIWNLLIFLVGISVGYNWEKLTGFFRTYSAVAWIVVGVAALAFLTVYLIRRRKRERQR